MKNFIAMMAMAMALPCAGLAAEEPEAVYAKLHRATLAGNVNEVLGHASAARRAEMAPLPGKEDMVRMMAAVMPKSYSITQKAITPDGRTALLQARGVHETLGPARATVQLFKEQGEWKVDEWSWSSLAPESGPAMVRVQAKQAEPMSKPAADEAKNAPAGPPPIEAIPLVPVEAPTLKKTADEQRPCVIKPLMSDEDLKRCGATPPKY